MNESLGAVAGLILAIVALITISYQVGWLGGDDGSPASVHRLEAEAAIDIDSQRVIPRSEASGARTSLVMAGETLRLNLPLDDPASCAFAVRYSNDNFGDLEQIALAVADEAIGRIDARDTGGDGEGWNVFEQSERIGPIDLSANAHLVELGVQGGDGSGIEIDYVEASCS